MMTLLAIIWCLLAVLLIALSAMRPERSAHSHYELHRRGDTVAIHREKLISSITGIKTILLGLVLAVLLLVGMAIWQLWGIAATAALWTVSNYISRQKSISRLARRLYIVIEPFILRVFKRYPILAHMFSENTVRPQDAKIESVEQLEHMVDSAGEILTKQQSAMIHHGLIWHETTVASVMTPKKKFSTINKNDLLGPLVLDDLHRTGHEVFPVIDDAGSIIGLLDSAKELEITAGKHSETAGDAMDKYIVYVDQDAYLPHALRTFQMSGERMLIVLNSKKNPVGLVTLYDVTGMFTEA